MPRMPLYDIDFWWKRYFGGLAIPVCLATYGAYSLISGHSYALKSPMQPPFYRSVLHFIRVQGEQALLTGLAYIGIALMLFAYCYVQYNERMIAGYQGILALGALLAFGGIFWCWSLF
ncbi:MAG TPA: hypothetical protein VGC39_11685 [Candidatus Methylacidiphilales bacterium]